MNGAESKKLAPEHEPRHKTVVAVKLGLVQKRNLCSLVMGFSQFTGTFPHSDSAIGTGLWLEQIPKIRIVMEVFHHAEKVFSLHWTKGFCTGCFFPY